MSDNIWVNIFGFACLLFIFCYLFYIIYYAIGLYDLNPFSRPVPLKANEKRVLAKYIPFLNYLDDGQTEKFHKRVAWFRAKKTFSFKTDLPNKEEIILMISGAGMLLTLGFRSYKFIGTIHRIVVHPTDYYSSFNKKYHLGEYNPGLKALAFAADNLAFGFKNSTDNINLAIHEFAHALYFETKGKNSWEALRFQWGFRKLDRLHNDKTIMEALFESGYFRGYAQANSFEFLSVLTENFIETSIVFKEKFPDLHDILIKMYNQKKFQE